MPREEAVDLVDEHDTIVGSATVGECVERGLLHRAVAVQVIRSSGKFLLQQRSRKDLWHPGLWTISSTGHVKKGETYDTAAARELKEELGLTANLVLQTKRLLPPIRSDRLVEHEWVSLYFARTDLPCIIDPVELEGVKEVTGPQLRLMLDGGSMTPDAVILLSEYLGGRSKAKSSL
jgi:isopentenyldiphosphate isomerase